MSDYTIIAESERTISIEMLAAVVAQHARGLVATVETHKRHPTYNRRKNILAEMNKVNGMFHLLMQMNGYKEIENINVRELVTNARTAVESLYNK